MRTLLILLIFLSQTSCYTLKQALRFNNLFNSRQSVENVLADENTNPRLKKKLKDVQDILSYASEQGLNSEGAYGYYIEMKKEDVSHVVQAAYPTRLKMVTWWFPFVGRVPYLGYFDIEERDHKAQQLIEKYDVHKARVGAFSSLGWFEDPIYTPMLRRNLANLSHLFFHELTHRTFWSRGSVRFNENLAEFVADEMTLQYLKSRKQSALIEPYLAYKQDKALMKTWIADLRKELRAVFKDKAKSKEQKLLEKQKIYQEFQDNKAPKFQRKAFREAFQKKVWNNASLLATSLYTPDTERFRKAFQCLGKPSMGVFLSRIEDAEDEHDDVFKALDSLCGMSPESQEEQGGKL